ncbi:MAG: DUF222 domain-containing protein [Beutenbergiaceae bacterium]
MAAQMVYPADDGACDRASADAAAEAVLGLAAGARRVEQVAGVQVALAALSWAQLHLVPAGEAEAATHVAGEAEVALAGDGAPGVAEFCVAEFGAAIGRTTAAARSLIGDVLELAYRLPLTWSAMVEGDLEAWRARRVAAATRGLPMPAVTFVDTELAQAGKRRGSQVLTERLVEQALARFDPDAAAEQYQRASERRRVEVDTGQVMLDGVCQLSGVLNVADALDLDRALNHIAAALDHTGSGGRAPDDEVRPSLEVRRSMALGVLARSVFGQTEPAAHPTATGSTLGLATGRQVVLYLHLDAASASAELTGSSSGTGIGPLGRCENTRAAVLTDQVRAWCGEAALVSIRPVLDLNQECQVRSYQVPDRLREQVMLRDVTCVFPWCEHPARSADIDHIVPFSRGQGGGGPTGTGNLAVLCRHHHRLKTHGGWNYTMVDPGVYHWTSPLGLTYARDRGGT